MSKKHYGIVKTTITNGKIEVESPYYGGVYTKPLKTKENELR